MLERGRLRQPEDCRLRRPKRGKGGEAGLRRPQTGLGVVRAGIWGELGGSRSGTWGGDAPSHNTGFRGPVPCPMGPSNQRV